MINPLTKVQKLLIKKGFDALLISSAPDISCLTNYTGRPTDEREIFLFITRNHQYVLTDKRYVGTVKAVIPNFKLVEISSKLSFEDALGNLQAKHKIQKLGINENDLKVKEFKSIRKHFKKTKHCDEITKLRLIKDASEISKIRKACQLGDKTFSHILKKIKVGVSEKEIAFEIEFFIKKHGADIAFSPVVAFGKNSAIPHHQPTNKKLKQNQIILLDFGARVDGYCSDMTRTVFFGKTSEKFRKMYNVALEAQKRAIDFLNHNLKQGIKAKSADKIARDYIISKGYESIPHMLGHGVGIDIHENPYLFPKSKDVLKKDMVFSIEPGIYIPDIGGIRIEDLVFLEKSGPRLLTHSPKDIIEL